MLVSKMEFERIKEELKNESFSTIKERILSGDLLNFVEYKAILENTKDSRMEWWRDARFGVFIHFGLYALEGRGEWMLARNGIPSQEYESLADRFMPKEDAAEEWVLTAKKAGAKYAILTTRHHDGFSLWKSEVNPYNSYNYGCKRDIVAEFVAACRKHDMKIGFYSTLMDWHHPDAKRMGFDSEARKRFLDYTEKLNIELMSNYGKIDVLWYDMPCPTESEYGWNTLERDQKLRALQPELIINDRGVLYSDYITHEETINHSTEDWESCFTFNTLAWGYIDEEQAKNFADSPQLLIKKLNYACRHRGNMLLNIGPRPDGTIADYEKDILNQVGLWNKKFKDVIYGSNQRTDEDYGSDMLSGASSKGNTVYIWNYIWPSNGIYPIAGYINSPKRVYFADTGENIDFEYDKENFTIIMKNLPPKSPEEILGIPVIAMEFDETPRFISCVGYSHLNQGYTPRQK